jgi:hypothetical protein
MPTGARGSLNLFEKLVALPKVSNSISMIIRTALS